MSRSQQDQFIDEDEEEEVCPLCVEELDLNDKFFKPCPCGYQICQFCYNNIKTTMNGLCPACRRPYKDENIQWKAVSPEEMQQHKQNLQAKAKKNAAAKQKEAQKREAEHLSRKHLAGLRVRQKNLVYVTGMKPKAQAERLIEILRGPQYFGQYGDIVKIVVSAPSKPAGAVGIYVTFARNEDAATCIQTMNNYYSDGSVRAQYGTTKYCSAYLRGETCNNRNCMFLHEPGDENERYTRQDLSSLNAISTQQPSQVGPAQASQVQAPPQETLPIAAVTQDNDSAVSPTDTSALPATANWGNQARRLSRATSGSAASPIATSSTPAPQSIEVKEEEIRSIETEMKKSEADAKSPEPSSADTDQPPLSRVVSKARRHRIPCIDDIPKRAFDPTILFKFAATPEVDMQQILLMPPLWDAALHARRREAKEREAEEMRRRQDEPPQSAQSELRESEATEPDEAVGAGSLQLGGEPEERPDRPFQSQQSSIQPPSQQSLSNATFGFNQQLGLGDELSGLGGPNRGLTPLQLHQQRSQQQHQDLLLSQLKVPQSAGQPPFGAASVHVRQNSRFSFNEPGSATTVKATGRGGPGNHFGALGHQQPGQFGYSGIQGPPPGLKTSTPPVSGGGMFGQGHGFTPGIGYGASSARESDKAWDSYRGQRGAQIPESGKRVGLADVADPSILQARMHQNGSMPGQGLYGGQGQSGFSSMYGGETLPFLGQADSSEHYFTIQGEQRPPQGFSLELPRRATPTVPPGLPIPPGFQPPTAENERPELQVGRSKPTKPAVASIPTPASRTQVMRPKSDAQTTTVRPSSPTPAEAAAKLKQAEKAPQPKVIPVVPVIPERAPTPKKRDLEAPAPTALPSAVTQRALASSHKDAEAKPAGSDTALAATVGSDSADLAKSGPDATDSSDSRSEEKPASKRPHPGKLDISKAGPSQDKDGPSSATSSVPAKPESLARKRAPSLTSSASSRPGTPAGIATGSPMRRTATQPRTLRITGTPSTETPPPIPSAGATSSSTPTVQSVTPAVASGSKVSSRRPSVTSLNAPGTPVSEPVDSISIASASASRASSPPPVTTNKKAEKKSRKKQKQTQLETETIAVKESVEEHAPIMSRKKKTKKPGDGPATKRTVTSSSTPQISQPASPKTEDKQKVPEVANSEESEEKTVPVKEPTGTHEPLLPPEPEQAQPEPAATLGAEREKEKPVTAVTIIQALEATQQLALSTLSLLKPLAETKGRNWLVDQSSSASSSSGTSGGNPSFTAADLHNHLDQLAFEISRAEAELLKRGEVVKRDTGDGRVSGRNLVTSEGLRFSCLSREEEERVIELTKAIAGSKGVRRWRPSRGMKTVAMTKVKVEGEATPTMSTGIREEKGERAMAERKRAREKDDIAAYSNTFIPPSSDFLLPNTSTGLLKSGAPSSSPLPAAGQASSSSAGNTSGRSVMTTEAYQRAEAVLENVTRQIEMGVRAAQGRDPNEAIGELASKVNAGIERAIGLYGGLHSGPGGILEGLRGATNGGASVTAGGEVVPGRGEKMSIKEAEQMLVEARKAAEVWERKVNAVVKRNRKMVFGGRE